MWSDIKTFFRWIWNILSLGSKISQIIKNQETIIKHLQDIKSPKEKIDELLKGVTLIEKINNAKIEEIKLKKSEQGAKDREEIARLQNENAELPKLKKELNELEIFAAKTLMERDAASKKLREKIKELEDKLKPKSPIFDIPLGGGITLGHVLLRSNKTRKSVNEIFAEARKNDRSQR